MNTIIDKLNNLAWKADTQINGLNAGGCAVFAYEVAKRLNELGIPAKGVVAMSQWALPSRKSKWPSVAKARENIRDVGDGLEWSDNGVDFHHVGVEFTIDGVKYHYDSNGVTGAKPWLNRHHWKVIPGRLSTDDLEKLVANRWNWNPEFDRRQVPKIHNMVEKALS